MRTVPRRLVVGLLVIYQKLVSPRSGPHCRYQPTCSAYAVEAISRFGALQGGWLAVRRLGSCHPLRAGGYDPVPDRLGTD